MESWIALYVLNEDYAIINSELLLFSFAGFEEDATSLKFGNQSIRFINKKATLTHSNRQYKIFTDDVFKITDDSGKMMEDIGIRKLTLITVNEKGKIIKRDSVVQKKEYYDIYWAKND